MFIPTYWIVDACIRIEAKIGHLLGRQTIVMWLFDGKVISCKFLMDLVVLCDITGSSLFFVNTITSTILPTLLNARF